MYCGHMLVVAVLVGILWQIQPTNGRRAVTNSAWYKALQKAKQPPPPATKEEKGCKGMKKMENERAISCLKLANCHLAHGDILRNRNESYESYYDEARKEIEHFNNRFKCGQRKIYRECQEKIKSCWAMAKMMAINGLDELLFVNDCDRQTMPYSHTLCIGKKIGHWPKDIYNVMENFYPTWCNMGCSMFREYNDFHKKSKVTEFPKDWNVGLELGLEDQDTRAMGRDIVSLAIMLSGMSTRSGLEVRNMMGEKIVDNNIAHYQGGFYCYRLQDRCENVKCPRNGTSCDEKDKITGERKFPCTVCRFDQKKLIEKCDYCGEPFLCDLYTQCTACSSKDDTCYNCAVGSSCRRGTDIEKNRVEGNCEQCSGCIGTSCQSCLGCFHHRTVMPHSPEAICLFYNNCTAGKVMPQGPGTPKQNGLMDDISKCGKNEGTKVQCLKRLIPVPWIVPMSVSFPGGYIDPKFITFITKSSVCRVKSWVVQIYDDLPDSIVGICFNDKHEIDSLDNRIGIPKMDDTNMEKFVDCDKGDNGILSYLRGATIQLTNDTENGTEYIHSVKWHCSARDEKDEGISRTDKDFGIPGKEGKKQTRMCPQEMVVCSLRTYIANIGGKASENKENYVIVNMEFGCCDVSPGMYYSGTNYMVQTREDKVLDNNDLDFGDNQIHSLPLELAQYMEPPFKLEPYGCNQFNIGDKIRAQRYDYRNCNPVKKLCPPGNFISRLGIEQWEYFTILNFKCTDYNGIDKSVVSLSEGLYKNRVDAFKTGVKETIDCGPEKYAFGITTAVQIVTGTDVRPYANMLTIQLHCGDNENLDSVKLSKKMNPLPSFDSVVSRGDYIFKCKVGQALCGFHIRPIQLLYTSRYDYKFICCPIPVRRFVLQSCPNGTTYDVDRDDVHEKNCRKSACGQGTAHGVISELVALPKEKPTFHNKDWHEKLRYAIVTSTNVNYGNGFSKYFDRNNRTGYIILDPVVLEPRDNTGKFITGATSALSLVTSLTGNLSTLAGKLGVVGGVLGIVSWVNDLINPKPDVVGEALEKITQQLSAIQDSIQQSRVYTEIQKLNVNLDIEFNLNLDTDMNDPRFYTVTATCGKAKYNMFGRDIFYYVPNKKCAQSLEEKWVKLQRAKILDNSNSKENRTFVVRFNSVGTFIKGEDKKPDSLSHWLKWEELIDNLKGREGFGQPGPIADVSSYSNLADLFKRPNSIKFYYVDVPVPAGHRAQVYQLVASCDRWQLYTKIINFKVSTKTDPLWDLIPDLADVRPVVRE